MIKARTTILALVFTACAAGQTPAPKFPPQVLAREASVVGVKTVPDGGTIKVDGTPVTTNPFILLKKDKPRLLRFELSGYRAVEKLIEPGKHYIIGIGVDFASHKADTVEFDQPPGSQPAGVTPAAAASDLPPAAPAPATAAPAAATPAPSASTPARATGNPFGFEFGMTKEQAIARIGKSAMVKDSGVTTVFNTAPNPHPDFEAYVCSFSPEKGLLKIVALSKNVETSEDGTDLRRKFDVFRDALRDKYGKPEKDFDFCKGNEVECRSEYYMMELKEKNRYLDSFWSSTRGSNLPLHIQTIAISGIALGLNKGYIEVAYEFEGWDAFADQQNQKRNSPF